jgi:Leucine-rich repeat (LRR) protein
VRKKKMLRLKEEQFWNNFFYFNVPKHLEQVPEHLERVNFRIYNVDDYGLGEMVEYVKTINMLDLDGTDVTNEGIAHLTKLQELKELRLKECLGVDNRCIIHLNKLTGLTLLHLGGTAITAKDVLGLADLHRLKLLLISSVDYNNEVDDYKAIKALLPNCELLVDHKAYE